MGGGDEMISLLTAVIALATSSAEAPMTQMPAHDQVAVTCFKSGERVSGMNKICYYSCLGSTYAITISSVELCPLTVDN